MSAPRNPSPKAATLHDVARVAGVSVITASRALSNHTLVASKTIARVQAAVQATGYIPNLLAGGLKSRRSRLVVFIVPAISVAQFLPTVQALTDTLAAAGYQLILGQTGYDPAREDALLDTMISRRPDAIVFTGLVQSEAARDRLRRVGIPVVETWDLSDHPLDMLVGFSHTEVGRTVARYFKARSWQRIGVATGSDRRALARRDAFMDALGRALPCAVVPAPSNLALGRQALCDLLRQEPALQAVWCSSDQLAQGVLVEARVRGLRVPEDLAVCGFGDAAFAAHTDPPITTVQIDGAAIGRLAAQRVIDRCQGVAIGQAVVDVGFRVVERRSTGLDGG